ncbi:MAG: nicotinamide mononucleotide deamidase-related protein [Candidatus Bathyarchaeota archaeon]|nr:MAG: nicotinamide mononucleotide deamidase-related protein [Candidatus Bathyarchaeum tardum]WNZ30112.1 MAG: nicotinamide mononucleotide deamidase-related protein [Candidatus Bathyarchaeota archaeon]
MNQSVEIICVGNELLIGKTLNTNAQWLTKRITTLGLLVKRVTVVGDNLSDISMAIKEAIQRKPCYVIITGGLGPTFDDMTLEGLAKALNRQTKVDDQALQMVAEKYRMYAKDVKINEIELTPHRLKMAKIPVGSTVVRNPMGTAPAVKFEHKNITIFALPGVPSEMKGIFEESIAPLLKNAGQGMNFFETSIVSTNVMESEMAPFIDVAMKDNPYVYIKSHPKGTETSSFIEFHLSSTDKDADVAKNRVNKALAHLKELIQKRGGTIITTLPDDF